jgi:hypothetical protein
MLVAGVEFLPIGEPCEGFTHEKGCTGHQTDEVVCSREPIITINGTLLSSAQAMTVRCAIESFASDLAWNGLGDDDVGRGICEKYIARIREIRILEGFK